MFAKNSQMLLKFYLADGAKVFATEGLVFQ